MAKEQGWRRARRVVSLVFAVTAFVTFGLMAVAWMWGSVPIGERTTRILGPLAADGMPDYLAAVQERSARGVTAANNAAPGVLAVVGLEGTSPGWKATELRLLGMADPGEGTLLTYSKWLKGHGGGAADAGEAYDQDAQVGEAPLGVWTRTERGQMADYLGQQGAALDALVAATERERFYLPEVMGDGSAVTVDRPAILAAQVAPLQRLRYAGNALLARAMLRLGEGDGSGFKKDLVGALRLSRLLAQQPTVLEYLVAMAANNEALKVAQGAATWGKLDGALAARVRGDLERERWALPVKQVDGNERFMALDILVGLTLGKEGDGIPGSGARLRMVPVHFSEALVETNGFFDRYRDAFGVANFMERRTLIEGIAADAQAQEDGGGVGAFLHPHRRFGALWVPRWSGLSVVIAGRDAEEALAIEALRLREWHSGKGAFPEKVDEAGPMGMDPFVGRALVYRREGGGYVLYSVGENLEDDGGKSRPRKAPVSQAAQQPWDRVLRAAE